MILVDTSVWVDHLRAGDDRLASLLEQQEVVIHPFILGEIALGTLRQRGVIIDSLRNLPRTKIADDTEVLLFIDAQRLHGRGIGYGDAHLLAAARLTAGASIWTRDRKLRAVAADLGLAANFE